MYLVSKQGKSAGVSKQSTVALLCYFLPRWCYFSFLVMKGATRHATHGATATVTCATAKSSLKIPGLDKKTMKKSMTEGHVHVRDINVGYLLGMNKVDVGNRLASLMESNGHHKKDNC